MKLHKKKYSGFTLVELLVVIAIIATLAGISVPIGLRVYNNALRTNAASAVKQTVLSFNKYYRDHNSLTFGFSATDSGASSVTDPSNGAAAIATGTYDNLIAALTATGNGTKTELKYLKLQDAKDADSADVADGITRTSSNVAHGIVDPWGNPYHLQLDTDYNETITIDATNYSEVANGQRFVMISAGPDGTFGNEDDVQSYR